MVAVELASPGDGPICLLAVVVVEETVMGKLWLGAYRVDKTKPYKND